MAQGGGSWSHGLIRDMQLAANQVIRSDVAVVMRDKFPKARHHFLVIPWADIDTVYQLNPGHAPLLEEMKLLGDNAAEVSGWPVANFRMGFHMKPSMHRLHLHVISQDFVSDRLRYREHYNSFTTAFFMSFESIMSELKANGRIEKRSQDFINSILKTPLACNQCNFQCSTLPQLKRHLEVHLEQPTLV